MVTPYTLGTIKHANPYFLTLVLLVCFKCLFLLYQSNMELTGSRPDMYYFVPQGVYMQIPRPIVHDEDWHEKSSTILEYRHKVKNHLKKKCEALYYRPNPARNRDRTRNKLDQLPEFSLRNVLVDMTRKVMYTGVVGAFGAKWSKFMLELNRHSGSLENLVRASDFVRTPTGAGFMASNRDIFSFYFVRNPLDRVISGYYYYFHNLDDAAAYMDGRALRELAKINNLALDTITEISFEQYLLWIIYGKLATKHFGSQSDIIRPCHIDYSLNGIFEILQEERKIVGEAVPDLWTPKSVFSTERNLTFLVKEAKELVATVNPNTMKMFYKRFKNDYMLWDYSEPDHWWYPFPGLIKSKRGYNPYMANSDWPRLKDISEDELPDLNKVRNYKKGRRSHACRSARGQFSVIILLVAVFLLF